MSDEQQHKSDSETDERARNAADAVTSFLRRQVSSPILPKARAEHRRQIEAHNRHASQVARLERMLTKLKGEKPKRPPRLMPLPEPPSIRMMLKLPEPEAQEIRAQRLRAEFARSILETPQFGESVQMLNELVVQELVSLSGLSAPESEKQQMRNRLVMKLEVVSEFQWLLTAMIDEYENTRLIQEQAAEQARTTTQEERLNEYG